jgi:hypothetical protein
MTLTPANGQIAVAFTPGSGGAASSYTATCSNANGVFSVIGTSSPITVTGLTNDQAYTCTVTATNAQGTSSATTGFNALPSATTPATAPEAPTIGAGTPGDVSAAIAFTDNGAGGSAIFGHTATCQPGSVTATKGSSGTPDATSPVTVTGLTNGTTYSCSVVATNAVGDSLPSGSVSVIPVSGGVAVPGAPTISTVIGSGTTLTVTFAGAAPNGSAITAYTANCTGATPVATTTGPASPLTLTGVTHDGTYKCTVTATNGVGTGPASTEVDAAWGTPPSAPTIGTATAGNAQISVAFTPGALGTGTLDHYEATCSVGGSGAGTPVSGSSSPIVVTGLSNGTAYLCNARTVSTVGTSPWSANSNSATPSAGTPPSAPTIGTATAGDAQISVAFTPGAQGTGTLINYEATCSVAGGGAGTPVSGSSSPIVVTGLTNGTAYLCNARTITSVGTSAWSGNSASTTPVAAGSCAATPGNYTVLDYPNYSSSSATYITTIGAGNGLALRFTINKTSYPLGYKLADAVGGSKSYKISRCPGATDGPVDGQNGTISVNGDGRNDNCQMVGAYVRYKETSGASATYYNNTTNLSFQTTCFLPTTTALGSSTPATYYLNILNTGTSTVSIQFQNQAQLN